MKLFFTLLVMLIAANARPVSASEVRTLHFVDHSNFGIASAASAPGGYVASYSRHCTERFVKGIVMPFEFSEEPIFGIGALMSTDPSACADPHTNILERKPISVRADFANRTKLRISETICIICAEALAGWPLKILNVRVRSDQSLDVTYATTCKHIKFHPLVTSIPKGAHGPAGFAIGLLEEQPRGSDFCVEHHIRRTQVKLPHMVPLDRIYRIQPTTGT